jgi:hypothetical protein
VVPTPIHAIISKPGETVSATVGTSFRAGQRSDEVIASARMLPPLILPNTTVPGVTMASTVLPSSPVTAAESPRNGTCKTLIPVAAANSSMPMCCPVPTPAVPMVNVPGFAFPASTKSLMVL